MKRNQNLNSKQTRLTVSVAYGKAGNNYKLKNEIRQNSVSTLSTQ